MPKGILLPRTWEMRSEPANIGAVLGVGILAITLTLFLVPALAFLASSIRLAVGRRATTN